MQRRSFFSRLGSMVAVVALAPELAFRTRLELPETVEYTANANGIYAILQECDAMFFETSTTLNIDELFKAGYRIREERKTRDFILSAIDP